MDVAVDALAAAREEIDALNVYPVPDGDTGTNMYLTMSAARDAIHQAAADGADLRPPWPRSAAARCSAPAATAASSSASCSGRWSRGSAAPPPASATPR